MTTESKQDLVLRREQLKDELTTLGAGSLQALKRTEIQAELSVINAKLRALNIEQSNRERVSAEQRRSLGQHEYAANTAASKEWSSTWTERTPLTRGELARMVTAVRMAIGTPDEAEAVQAVLAAGPVAIRWLCEHVRMTDVQKLATNADGLVAP